MDKRNFTVSRIYIGIRDGWSLERFRDQVVNQGPIIILVKTKTGAICGGYTSIGLTNMKQDTYVDDN